ncbi:Wzz/FepE/Etk N-terminal domain-containing protein [Photobacterium sagamiensis]|uniref:LPS O-antigen chain length determinant protein WzzB n=1 Tax=Photobacterium sagamiensis TaxID=2910241 RepID=UPI003D11310C
MTEHNKDVTQNYQPTPPLQHPANSNQSRNDEINLTEFFYVLWKEKIQIIVISLFFTIIAALYAFTAQEWWSAKAKVIAPQITDFAEFRLQVKQFQPAFDLYQDDGTILVNETLDSLVEAEKLFEQFLYSFNSLANKKTYLHGSKDFQQFLTNNKIHSEEAINETLEIWFDKIKASQTDQSQDDVYSLSLQAINSEQSYNMLNGYISYVSSKVYDDEINNLRAVVSAKKNELSQTLTIFESQAKNNLEVEIQRTKYALEIAKSAQLTKPIQNLGDKEIFAINMGSDALAAKVKALESVNDFSLIDPRIQQVKAKLALLDQTKIKEDMKFDTYRFLENVEKPSSRDKPNRSLILILGTLLGGMLAVPMVLIRHAFINSKK